MAYLVIDIETGPNQRLNDFVAQTDIKPASNLKDPEKIAKNVKEREAKVKSQAALHWWTGRVVCIGYNQLGTRNTNVIYSKDEQALLCQFGLLLHANPGYQLIAKNVEFDRPFLIGRYIAHNLGIPDALRTHHMDRMIDDVDKIFSFRKSQCSQVTTLANYAFGMMIEGKLADSADMSKLFMAWMMGDEKAIETITKHCIRDVDITAELLQRSLKKFEPLRKPHEEEEYAIPF